MSRSYAIGIDLGGSNLRVALATRDGEVIERVKEPTSQDILNSIFRLTEPFFSEEIEGIGLGVAGLVDREKGKVLVSPNLSAVEGIELVKEMRARFNVPVFIENDANCAALGEKWIGAGRKFSNFVLLTLGTGIGGGIIQGDKLLNVAAEIGHMTINADGEKCYCGNIGCLESYASARAIMSKVVSALEEGRVSMLSDSREGDVYKINAEDIYRVALEGDRLAKKTFRDAGRYLGVGIANIINVLSPEAVILAGGLTGAWDIYIEEAIKEAARRSFKDLFDAVKIIPSLLGDNAGVIGSAGLVFHGNQETYN